MWAAGVMRLCQSNKVVLLKPFWRTGLIDRYTFNSEAANNQEIRFLCTIIAVYLKGQVMLKRQLTEGNVDDGVGDFKRSRMEDMALVTMSSDQSQQQLMIAENKNKVSSSLCSLRISSRVLGCMLLFWTLFVVHEYNLACAHCAVAGQAHIVTACPHHVAQWSRRCCVLDSF